MLSTFTEDSFNILPFSSGVEPISSASCLVPRYFYNYPGGFHPSCGGIFISLRQRDRGQMAPEWKFYCARVTNQS